MRTAWIARTLLWSLIALGCGEPESALEPSIQLQSGTSPAAPEARAGASPAAQARAIPLRIATWNLEWLHRADRSGEVKRVAADYERLRGYAERLAADVIAFQEVDGAAAARRVFDPAVYAFHVAAQEGRQLTGFAYRKSLTVAKHPDFTPLSLRETVRAGADLTVQLGATSLRLLSVHLKAGCQFDPLSSGSAACRALQRQLPLLEQWIDARASEGTPFLVLGDFNRRLDRPDDPFWRELDDGVPANSHLRSATAGLQSRCWSERHAREYIDHIVLGLPAASWLVAGSVREQLYDGADRRFRSTLSDHCPLLAELAVPRAAAQR